MHLPSQWVDPLLKCTSLLPTIQHSTRHFIGKVTTFSLDYVFSLVSGSKKRICVKITESERLIYVLLRQKLGQEEEEEEEKEDEYKGDLGDNYVDDCDDYDDVILHCKTIIVSVVI